MTALRVAAFAIAIMAVIDPALTTSRSSQPLISVLAADSAGNAATIRRVERLLSRDFTVVRGSIPAASGTVLVGDRLPDEGADGPLMVIEPAHVTPFVRIVDLDVAATPSLNARIPVTARIVVRGARGRRLNVEARVGAVRVDQQFVEIAGDTVEVGTTLVHVPTSAGATLLRVSGHIEGTSIADEATTAIDVSADRLAVLFFDPRASWLSTFVRRSIERDPRFAATHRVMTSRGLSNTAGAAPVSLRDAPSLAPFGTIVVGSPEQLTDADVSGLDAFMRERGGRVVLLMDRRAAGPIDRLTGAGSWRAVRLPAVASLQNESSIPDSRFPIPELSAQEIAWPTTLPVGASVHSVSIARDSTRRAVVWSVPVGAGALLVSAALDAWHHRDEASGFDSFWSTTVAELTASAPRAVEVTITNRALAPGQATNVRVWIRDAALSRRGDRSATVSATLASPNDTTSVRLWPGNAPGTFTGRIVAPTAPGVYGIIASSGAERSEASLIVDPAAREPALDERHLMAAFAASRKGRVIPEAELRDLPRALSSALQSVSRVETWHPMRTAWWIAPFALLLGAEWWWRRRRGLG